VAAALISIGISIGVGAAPPSEPPSEPAELAWQDAHEGIAIEARMEVLEEECSKLSKISSSRFSHR
jgi:hypothetical protein